MASTDEQFSGHSDDMTGGDADNSATDITDDLRGAPEESAPTGAEGDATVESDNENRQFGGARLLELFAELDGELASLPSDSAGPHRIAIAGGAAMALRVPGRVTGDVDVVSEGLSPTVRRAAERVAARYEIRPDWLNDAVKIATIPLAPELDRVFDGKNLVVETVSPKYLLAMKLLSARPEDRADCIALIQQLKLQSLDELLDLIEDALPRSQRRTVTMQYFAEDVLRQARAQDRPIAFRFRR